MDTQKILNEIIKYALKNFKPPKAWSWQTLILLSSILGIAAVVGATVFTAFLPVLVVLSGLFLIGGVAWYTTKEPITIQGISIGSWVTGALICLLLFGIWGNPALLPIGLISWPLVSAAVAAIPEFWHEGLKLKTPNPEVRQNLVILLLINLLLSCWLLFSFVVQGWLQQYPSIAADNLSQSFFVNRLDFGSTNQVSRGNLVLNNIETRLRDDKNGIDGKVWPDVERWLLSANDRVGKISQEVTQNLSRVEEDALWEYGANVTTRESGYNLNLLANSRAPSSRLEGYHLTKLCRIILSRRRGLSERSPVSLSDLQCDPVSQPARGLLKINSTQKTNR